MTADDAIAIVVNCLRMRVFDAIPHAVCLGASSVPILMQAGAKGTRRYHSVITPPGVATGSADEVHEEWTLDTPIGIIHGSRVLPPTTYDRIEYCMGDATKTYKLTDRLVMELTGWRNETSDDVRVQGSVNDCSGE